MRVRSREGLGEEIEIERGEEIEKKEIVCT